MKCLAMYLCALLQMFYFYFIIIVLFVVWCPTQTELNVKEGEKGKHNVHNLN